MLTLLILAVATSTDAAAIAVAYGVGGIKIPTRSALVVAGVSALLTAVGFFIGSFLIGDLFGRAAAAISFAALTLIGLFRIFSHLIKSGASALLHKLENGGGKFFIQILRVFVKPETADKDNNRTLNIREAVFLSLSISIDGIFSGAGVGAGFSADLAGRDTYVFGAILLGLSITVCAVAIIIGAWGGRKFGAFIKKMIKSERGGELFTDIFSGVILILLGIMQLL